MTITQDQIAARLSQARGFFAPNYFGHVPSDYEAVAEGLPIPSAEEVESAARDNPDLDLDGCICAAGYMPDGYEGVALDMRWR